MITKFLDPKNDFAFQKIFGTEKNKDILIHFLNREWDHIAVMDQKFDEGMEKGIEEGIKKVVQRMLSNGMNVQTIASVTGLSVDDIIQIK